MGIFFSILSPAIYGINNYIDKFFLEKYSFKPAVISIYSGIAGLLAGLLVLVFSGLYTANIQSLFIIIASGFLTNMYVLPYFKALSTDETSRIVPLFQLAPIFVLILSFFFLGETLKSHQYIGAAFIIVGSFIVSMEKLNLNIFKLRPAFWYMVLSSFLFALSIVLYKFGVEEIPFWQTLPYEGFGMALGAFVLFLFNHKMFIKQTKKFPKKVYAVMAVNESFYIAARYCGYFALSLISVSIVNILGGVQPLIVLIYGIILSLWFPKILKEIITKEAIGIKLFAIVFIFIGLCLIFF